jgi:hypothetical protein
MKMAALARPIQKEALMAAADSTRVIAEDGEAVRTPSRRGAPEVVAPSNRVNVALPFARITVQEPSRDLAELASIVTELVAVVESLAPGPAMTRLRKRARALVAVTTR